jgi:hypothetical protein
MLQDETFVFKIQKVCIESRHSKNERINPLLCLCCAIMDKNNRCYVQIPPAETISQDHAKRASNLSNLKDHRAFSEPNCDCVSEFEVVSFETIEIEMEMD